MPKLRRPGTVPQARKRRDDQDRRGIPRVDPRRPQGLHQRRDASRTSRRIRCSSRSSISAPASTTCSTRPATAPIMTYDAETARPTRSPTSCRATQQDWWDKRRATDTVLEEIGGVVTRVGDETVGEMWSLYRRPGRAERGRPALFARTSATTSPRSCTPTRSTSRPTPIRRATARKRRRTRTRTCSCMSSRRRMPGIVVRGAKYETAAAYANQAFTKPTIANWGNSALSDYARRLHLRPRLAGPEIHLPHRLCRPRAGGGLPALQPLRRGRHAGRLRRRADPLGERALLPPHQGGDATSAPRCTATRPSPSCSAT